MKGDLHVHTDISDSSYNLIETLEMAKANDVTHIGIVNHDTVRGLKEAIDMGKRMGIKVIPGIEISSYDFTNNRKVHILGYNFNLEGRNIRKLCDPLLERRNENSRRQMETLIKFGYKLDTDYINEKCRNSRVLYKQHIMMGMIKAGYTHKIYSDLYRELFKNGGICDYDIEYVDALSAVQAIKDDGGLAVLAHPGQLNSYSIIPNLIKKGLDGIERYHHSHTEKDIDRVKEICKRYDLIQTGGTDFHGEYGEKNIMIGQIESPIEYLDLF